MRENIQFLALSFIIFALSSCSGGGGGSSATSTTTASQTITFKVSITFPDGTTMRVSRTGGGEASPLVSSGKVKSIALYVYPPAGQSGPGVWADIDLNNTTGILEWPWPVDNYKTKAFLLVKLEDGTSYFVDKSEVDFGPNAARVFPFNVILVDPLSCSLTTSKATQVVGQVVALTCQVNSSSPSYSWLIGTPYSIFEPGILTLTEIIPGTKTYACAVSDSEKMGVCHTTVIWTAAPTATPTPTPTPSSSSCGCKDAGVTFTNVTHNPGTGIQQWYDCGQVSACESLIYYAGATTVPSGTVFSKTTETGETCVMTIVCP